MSQLQTSPTLQAEELRDLCGVQRQLLRAVNRLAEDTSDKELRALLTHHQVQTQLHLERLRALMCRMHVEDAHQQARADDHPYGTIPAYARLLGIAELIGHPDLSEHPAK